jgi:hypothetical protein
MDVGVKSYRLGAPLAPGERTSSSSTSRSRSAASATRARTRTSSRTARSSTAHAAADPRLPGARRARDRPRPQEVRPRAARAHAAARGRRGAPGEPDHDRRRLHRVRGRRRHRGRAARDRARLPRARLDRRQAALLRVQDGRADPQLLRVPVGPLCGPARPLERRRDRDLVPAGARVQPRPDGRRDQGRARLLHRGVRPYQHRQFRIIEFPRYQTFAQAFPNTIPYSEGSASSRACATTTPTTSTTRTT